MFDKILLLIKLNKKLIYPKRKNHNSHFWLENRIKERKNFQSTKSQ